MVPRLPKGFSHPMRIGGGSFGAVYRVRQTSVDRWVALKLVEEKDSAKRRSLLKEAITQARLRIECVPQVYDAFEWGPRLCIVMQWIRGVSLADLLASPLDDGQRLWLAGSLLRALARLHAEGYAHRDLKPANVNISPTEGLFLVDFGFTKNVQDSERSMSGIVKGTPAYMAPEVWRRGGDVDYMRADVYAAGLILREILGRHPYAAFAETLLSEDPALRDSNAVDAYHRWIAYAGGEAGAGELARLAAGPTSEKLALGLLAAARELLGARRDDEAYWLLVECLEQNPNMAEAVLLMNSFPHIMRRRTLRRRLALAALTTGVAVVAGTVAFVAGWHGRNLRSTVQQAIALAHEPETALLKASRAGGVETEEGLVFMDDRLTAEHLSGFVVLKKYPASGSLSVDGLEVGGAEAVGGRIPLDFGLHALTWKQGGTMVWRERVFLLPFQVKGLMVRAR